MPPTLTKHLGLAALWTLHLSRVQVIAAPIFPNPSFIAITPTQPSDIPSTPIHDPLSQYNVYSVDNDTPINTVVSIDQPQPFTGLIARAPDAQSGVLTADEPRPSPSERAEKSNEGPLKPTFPQSVQAPPGPTRDPIISQVPVESSHARAPSPVSIEPLASRIQSLGPVNSAKSPVPSRDPVSIPPAPVESKGPPQRSPRPQQSAVPASDPLLSVEGNVIGDIAGRDVPADINKAGQGSSSAPVDPQSGPNSPNNQPGGSTSTAPSSPQSGPNNPTNQPGGSTSSPPSDPSPPNQPSSPNGGSPDNAPPTTPQTTPAGEVPPSDPSSGGSGSQSGSGPSLPPSDPQPGHNNPTKQPGSSQSNPAGTAQPSDPNSAGSVDPSDPSPQGAGSGTSISNLRWGKRSPPNIDALLKEKPVDGESRQGPKPAPSGQDQGNIPQTSDLGNAPPITDGGSMPPTGPKDAPQTNAKPPGPSWWPTGGPGPVVGPAM